MSNNIPKKPNPEPAPPGKVPPVKPGAITAATAKTAPTGPASTIPPSPVKVPPLFRRIDWFAFGVTTLLTFIGYWLTLAPELTLQDSGELAVASMYAGVPHPPGYPVWTLYTWLFTLIPVSNMAYRVGLSSAVAGALGCGLVAMMVSRGSSMMIEGIAIFKGIERRMENGLCIVAGFVAGMLIGFNGFMWSQAVIVEVYTLSVLSLAGVLVGLLRWIYAPHQRRYLYLAFFWFGICFNNHQSLLVVALGLEVAIVVASPKLGRTLLLWNVITFVGALFMKVSMLTENNPLMTIFCVIGMVSAAGWLILVFTTKQTGMELLRDLAVVGSLGYVVLLLACITNYVTRFQYPSSLDIKTGQFVLFNLLGVAIIVGAVYLIIRDLAGSGGFSLRALLGKEYVSAVICGLCWMVGAAFYLYMPLAGMTNPPLNWGYPRTVTGFFHAFTRGQYERIHPTTSPTHFVSECIMYIEGALEEFNLVFILIGLIPFFFYKQLQKRERAWILGLAAIYFTLSVFLLILLNPASDRQSRDLNKPFFTASHVLISMGIGYGLTLIGSLLVTQYAKFRQWALIGAAVSAATALYGVAYAIWTTPNPMIRNTAYFGLILAITAGVIIFLGRDKVRFWPLLAAMAAMPIYSILSHWEDNEQRGHYFGYYFGHDMFTPPFKGPDGKLSYDKKLREQMMKGPEGKLIYPEMDRDTILFGGTDPGRFNPTYMIFCDSFIPASKKPEDPAFDRRDVYLITQNALADGTYLSYIRAQYNRSTQKDPPFFQELLRGPKELEQNYETNIVSRMFIPVDRYFTDLGARIEARRRKEGVYPPVEINTPSNDDSQRSFQEYLQDAQQRLEHDRRFPNEAKQIRPGEDVKIVDNKVQVSGQVAVMAINGLLTKVIFDKNPTNSFYVEESFPLDWMYPYLTPYGIIMKINRDKLPELTEEIVQRDHKFWSDYSDRLVGNWITYDTTVSNICAFAEKVYHRRDFKGFKGDPRFVRDNDGQKAFSKLRSSIAGVYSWRIPQSHSQDEQKRMIKEAEFSFKQAYAFCPYSPEAVFRYINLLISLGRVDDARLIANTSQKLDPNNTQIESLIGELDRIKRSQGAAAMPTPEVVPPAMAQLQAETAALEKQWAGQPTNWQTAVRLVMNLMQLQQGQRAVEVLDQIMANPQAGKNEMLFAAQAYNQLSHIPKVEQALSRLVRLAPDSPEAWFDLAGIQAVLNLQTQAIASLTESLKRSADRRAKDPKSPNLYTNLLVDEKLNSLRPLPDFNRLLTQYASAK